MPEQGADNSGRRPPDPRRRGKRRAQPDWLRVEPDEAATRASGRPTARLVVDLRRPSFWLAVARGLMRALRERSHGRNRPGPPDR